MRYLLILVGLFSEALLAQSETPANPPLEPISSPYLVKLAGGLVLIVVVIFLLAWLARKFNLSQPSSSGLIRIIAGLSLGTRDRIVLLQIGDEQILLGLSPGRIEKLHTLARPLDTPVEQAGSGSFGDRLNRLMGERKSS